MGKLTVDEHGMFVYDGEPQIATYTGFARMEPAGPAFMAVQDMRAEAIRLIDLADEADPERKHLPDNWRRPMMRKP